MCGNLPRRQTPSRLERAWLSEVDRSRRVSGDPMKMRLAGALLGFALLVSSATAAEIYDLLLKNGHVIDLKNKRNGRFDIAIIGNKIARVGENLPAAHAKTVVD